MSGVLAWFLTWSTYGSRLHGDPRGTVDDEHNKPESPLLPTDAARFDYERSLMCGPKITLSPAARALVEGSIREHAGHKGWRLLAINVRTEHVHVVVSCAGAQTPERVMSSFKAWATRRLRERGEVGVDARVWTHHGSTRWIRNPEGLVAAIDYVTRLQ